MTAQTSLFPDPAAIPETREAREVVLSKLPERVAPVVRIARAVADPCGHLFDCQDASCPDCADLRAQGFQRCSRCPRWAHQSCLYDGICSACMIADSRPLDGREARCEWTPPLSISDRARRSA
jgi:hypothetical protein